MKKAQGVDIYTKPEGMSEKEWAIIEQGSLQNRKTAISIWQEMQQRKAESITPKKGAEPPA